MDINQLIVDLQEISQKNSISHYKRDRCAASATALSTLQAENEKLLAELAQVKRERDAAVEDLSGQCEYCLKRDECVSRKGPHWSCWEWRGPVKED